MGLLAILPQQKQMFSVLLRLKLFLHQRSLLAFQTASQLNSKKVLQDYTD